MNLFPDHIKVFLLSVFEKNVLNGFTSILLQHFRELLSDETFEKLAKEIAVLFKNKELHSIYSFFYSSNNNTSAQTGWVISSGKLNISVKGLPEEIVFFLTIMSY